MIRRISQLLKTKLPKKVQDFLYEKIASQIVTLRFPNELSTFSQAGEDAVIRFLFLDFGLNLSNVSYLDIGARHPTNGNNTFFFYIKGSKGVCVDADKEAIPLLKEMRPRDKILRLGVVPDEKKWEKFFFMEGGGSTMDEGEYEKRIGYGGSVEKKAVKVPTITINKLIRKYFKTFPVLLSIDIEGLDLATLKTLDFKKYPIPVICVETCGYSENHIRPKDRNISNFLISKGYQVYADTYINTVFVNKNWFNAKK